MKTFKEIIDFLKEKDNLITYDYDQDFKIEDISYDSRDLGDKCLFFCKGLNFKEEYLDDSLAGKAIAYVSEVDYGKDCPYIIVKDIRKAMVDVAAFFFDYPSEKLFMIGVTGTKGKSSTVQFINRILDEKLLAEGKKEAGVIGAIRTYDGVNEYEHRMTTPEAIYYYKNLNNAVKSGIKYLVMEVSSQALKYNRVDHTEFDIGIFLNIGRDHVSPKEHPSMEDYFQSKLKLVDMSKMMIYNKDMDMADRVLERIEKDNKPYLTFSRKTKDADIYFLDYHYEGYELAFSLGENGQEHKYKIKQIGDYNIENVMPAILVARQLGIEEKYIKTALYDTQIPGRGDLFITDDKKVVAFVNYGHNGLSFQKVFDTIEEVFPTEEYKVVTLLGAPGNKSRMRLEDVSNIGAQHSDLIYIIPNDPADRDFHELALEHKKIIDKYGVPTIIMDSREKAIHHAFEHVEGKTIILPSGKGTEPTQLIGKTPYKYKIDPIVTKEAVMEYNQRLKDKKKKEE